MSRRWTTVAALLGALVTAAAVGCVPKSKYDEALAAVRNANAFREKAESSLNTVRADNRRLTDEKAALEAAMADKDGLLGKLQSTNADLDKALKELYKKYEDALAGRKPLVFIRLPERVDTALRDLAKQNPDLMEYLPDYGMLKLKSDLTFDLGSANVKPGAEDALKKLAEIVNTPEAQAFHVYAAGHTDNVPLRKPETIARHGSNWGLSLHRAGEVVKVLATAGVEQRRLGAMGFSKYHPVAPNDPKTGNALNRRVEIWIVPQDRLLTVTTTVPPEK